MVERIISDESGDTTQQVTLDDLLSRLTPEQRETYLNRLTPAQQQALLDAFNGEQAGALQVLLEGVAQAEQQTPRELTRRRDFAGEQTRELARGLAAQSLRSRAGLIREALSKQTALQAGSQSELFQALRPQIAQLQGRLDDAFRAIDSRLGPGGGGSARRLRGQQVAETTAAIQQLLQRGAQAGFGGVLEAVSGTRPGVTANLAPVGSARSVGSFGDLGSLAASLYNIGDRIITGNTGPQPGQLSAEFLASGDQYAPPPVYQTPGLSTTPAYQGGLSGPTYSDFGGQVGAPGE